LIKFIDSKTYNFRCLQNIHSRWVAAKIVFLKGLGFKFCTKRKPRSVTGAFFSSISSLPEWRELICHIPGQKIWFGMCWL
jgi:hypothetical protein